MVVAVLKLYFIGTALMVLAVLYEIVDFIGGLMYVQNQRYFLDLHQEKQRRKTVTCKTQQCKHSSIHTVAQACWDEATNE